MSALKKASAILPPDEFSYDELTAPDQVWLRGKEGEMHSNLAITHQIITNMGKILIEVRERIPGRYLAWARTCFGISDDTVENYVNVATNIPFLSDQAAALITAKALYKLAGNNADSAGVAAALDKLESGEPVDFGEAYILSRAPTHIREQYLANDLPKEQAHEVTKALVRRGTPDTVRDYCIEKGVTHAAVVNYLTETFNDEKAQAGWKNGRKTWSAIVEDDGNLNGLGWSLPISKANERDIDRFKVDRQAMHIDQANERFDWKVTRGQVKVLASGEVVLVLQKGSGFDRFLDREFLVQVRVPTEQK